jgi:hypothetical protein
LSQAGTKQQNEGHWGNWRFLPKEKLLQHASGYRVDFKRMDTCAGMLDIIFQVETKAFDAADVGQLVTALADIFNPQANLCSDGIEKPFDAELELNKGMQHGFYRMPRR